jgi:predicted small metal-binding protein
MRTGWFDALEVTPTLWQYAAHEASRRLSMAKLIRCECGFVARGESDDQVIGVIRGHMERDHPTLLEAVSQDDLRSWIQAE